MSGASYRILTRKMGRTATKDTEPWSVFPTKVEISSMFLHIHIFQCIIPGTEQFKGSLIYYWAAPIIRQLELFVAGWSLPRVFLIGSGYVLCSYTAWVYFHFCMVTQQIFKGSKSKAFSFPS